MKTPEEKLGRLVDDLQSALGPNLSSVILYGSAARGDHAGINSDLNVMVEVENGSPLALEPAAPVQRKWKRDGNPPLLFVTGEWIRNSTDVFPLEFTDMLEAHRVLHGEDPLGGARVSRANLRHQCEHEIRSLVLHLRAAYLDAHGKASRLLELVVGSFGSMATVARASLRLVGDEVPLHNEEVLEAAARRFGLDGRALRAASEIKKGRKERDIDAMKSIFLGWFDQIAALGRALDALRTEAPGSDEQEH